MKKELFFILFFSLIFISVGAESKKELLQQNEELKKQFNTLAVEKAKLERDKKSIEQEKIWINEQLEKIKLDNAYKDKALNATTNEISQTRKIVEESRNIILETQEELKEQSDSMASLAKAKQISDLLFAQQNLELEKQKLETENQKAAQNILIGGIFFVLFVTGLLFYLWRTKKKSSEVLELEKKKSDDLLLNILPEEIADELKKKGKSAAKSYTLVTVLFADIKNFTKISEKLTPDELIQELDFIFGGFDQIIEKHNIEKIKIIGDAYMCAGGIPVANTSNPLDVVKAAMEMQALMYQMNIDKKQDAERRFELRIGVHSGPVVAGIVGTKKFAYDIWGDAVNIASRMESSGEAGKINISQTTYDLVKDYVKCTYRGKLEAKNKGQIDMYFVD